MIERQTAKKVRIADITGGEWVKREGMEPSFVITPGGEDVARARVMGTVVSRFVSVDGSFASITIDDSTDTIRAKAFQETRHIDGVAVGDLVDVIGKVRVYNNEMYIIPEVVLKVADPNAELLRRLELLRKLSGAKAATAKSGKADRIREREQLRKDVIRLLEKNKDGTTYEKIVQELGVPDEAVEPVINDLLAEGICYEPTPGKVRKI